MSGAGQAVTYASRPRCGLFHNMSAPPRTTVSFRPYGFADATPGAPPPSEQTCGLRRLLRADPDALLKASLPALVAQMSSLRQHALALAKADDKGQAARTVAQVRALRVAGLLELAATLAGGTAPWQSSVEDGPPVEALLDRLADQAGKLPPPPASLPALAIAESLAGGGARSDPGCTDALAVLWTLTRVNGRTFDRDGLPHLCADLAEGGAWDLYVPFAKEAP